MNTGLPFNLSKQLDIPDTAEKLGCYRSRSNPFDALAHKHLLYSLTKETVMHNIKQENPTLSNLIPEIINHFHNNLNQ